MMALWRGNAFGITGPLWRESTGHCWFPSEWVSGASVFSLLLVWTNWRTNIWVGGDLRRHGAHEALLECYANCILINETITNLQHSTKLQLPWHVWNLAAIRQVPFSRKQILKKSLIHWAQICIFNITRLRIHCHMCVTAYTHIIHKCMNKNGFVCAKFTDTASR